MEEAYHERTHQGATRRYYSSRHRRSESRLITYLNHTDLQIGLSISFGERSLRHRRVFPSPQAAEFRINHQWLFVPNRLKATLSLSV